MFRTSGPRPSSPQKPDGGATSAILDGAYDDIPEEAFRFTGGIDQVVARARGPR